MMKLETIIYEKQDEIAWIKFNRPNALNAENDQLAREFPLALEEARKDPDIKVIILKGEGRAFCAGADVKEQTIPKTEEEKREHVRRLQNTAQFVRDLGKPIIAAVHGYALGAGCEYAMICDIRIAAEGAKFGFPEASVGAPVTTAGTQILPRLVGLGRAKELIFTSEMIDAKEAERIGLVNKVVPLAELEKTSVDMAKKIAKNSTLAIRLLRGILDRSFESSMDTVLQLESNVAEIASLAGTSTAGFEAKKRQIADKK